MKKKMMAILLCGALLAALAGCGSGSQADGSTAAGTAPSGTAASTQAAQGTTAEATEASHAADPEESKTDNTGDFTIVSSVADGYSVSGGVYTITAAGSYSISGTLTEGQIVIDAEDQKVELILGGVTITNSSDAPIKALAADKLTVTAADGSYNEITDSRALKTEDDEESVGGAVYAKCDLTLAGTGSLVVTGSYNNGIHTTKDLKIKELTLKVTAPNNALKGKDSVTIESGNLTVISTGGDGIKTEDSDISSKGNQRGTVTISGGVIDIYAAGDGIDASYNVEITKGDPVLNIYTDSYSPYTGEMVLGGTTAYIIVTPSLYSSHTLFAAYYYNDDRESGVWAKADYAMNCYSGRTTYYALSFTAPSGYENVAYFAFDSSEVSLENYAATTSGGAVSSMNAYLVTSESGSVLSGDYVSLSAESGSSVSTKGIKADNEIYIASGTITVYSTDDSIHANNDVTLENGATGLGNITVAGGGLTLSSGDDGIHADGTVTIEAGTVNVVTSYEGIEGNLIYFNGGTVYVYATDDGVNACGGSSTPLVQVNGGYLQVTTKTGDTDGIDSNGNYVQTGGFVLVQGGASQGMVAGSVDVDGSITVSGGTIVALGGICETPVSSSCNTVVMSGQSFSSGSYTVNDGSGNIITFTVDGSYSGAWISSDLLSLNTSYTLSKDGSSVYTWTQSSQTEGASAGGNSWGGGGGWGPGGGGGGRR